MKLLIKTLAACVTLFSIFLDFAVTVLRLLQLGAAAGIAYTLLRFALFHGLPSIIR